MTTRVRHTVMGTVAIVDCPSDQSITPYAELVALAFRRLDQIDERFSTYETNSEASRYGRGEIDYDDISDDLREVLDLADKFRAATKGFFDIYGAARSEPAASVQRTDRAGARPIEPSGVVKGWAIQQAADVLSKGGLHDFCMDVGGDVYASGYNGDRKWRLGLAHPLDKAKTFATVEVNDCAVATSGSYERGSHIVSPFGENVDDLWSVTVVGPDITMADAYATAIMAMGHSGLEWAQHLDGFETYAVDAHQMTHRTAGFDRFLAK